MEKLEYQKLGFEYVGKVSELISFAGKFIKFLPKDYKEKIKLLIEIIKVKSIVLYINNGILVYKIVSSDAKAIEDKSSEVLTAEGKPKMRSIKDGEKIS